MARGEETMNKRLGFSILGVALSVAPILAATPPADGGPSGEGHLQRVADHLGLTADQQAAWKSLFEQHKAETAPLRQEGRELHERLKAAVSTENPDPTAVGAATLALKEHRQKVKAAHSAFETRLTSTLTPEQKTKFEALKAAHQRHGHFMGPRGRNNSTAPEAPQDTPAPVKG
jgi:Spy/CpxP family protein refolding chaperone